MRVGLVGVGKIARDQHMPALAASSTFTLAACASRNASVPGIDSYPDPASMLAARRDLDCVSVCTPPQAHFDAALLALRAGKHVLLEKPPAATTRQIALLAEEAARLGRTLFQSWHSRFAAGVAAARDWLRGQELTGGRIVWKEDVRVWHPGQRWIWAPGGFGVFDPGINALSILTDILDHDVYVQKALLEYPSNQQTPIAADLLLQTETGARLSAQFDFRQTGEQIWEIELHDGARSAPAIPRRRGACHRRQRRRRRREHRRILAALRAFRCAVRRRTIGRGLAALPARSRCPARRRAATRGAFLRVRRRLDAGACGKRSTSPVPRHRVEFHPPRGPSGVARLSERTRRVGQQNRQRRSNEEVSSHDRRGGAGGTCLRKSGDGAEEDARRGREGPGQPVLHRAGRWLRALEQGEPEVRVHLPLHRPGIERRRSRRSADRRRPDQQGRRRHRHLAVERAGDGQHAQGQEPEDADHDDRRRPRGGRSRACARPISAPTTTTWAC